MFQKRLLLFIVVGPDLAVYHPRAIKQTWKINHTCVIKYLLDQTKKFGILKKVFCVISSISKKIYWKKLSF